VEVEDGSGDVTAAGSGGVEVTDEKSHDDDDNNEDDNDDDGRGKMRPHRFDKNIYTFSAAAGRALQQQTGNIRNLV